MEWLEVAAPSVDTAKEIALDRLGVHESDAELEIITEGKIGLFGRVKEEARVRARILPTPVRPKIVRRRSNRRSQSSVKRSGNGGGRSGAGGGRSKPAPENLDSANAGGGIGMQAHKFELSLDEQADLAESFVQGIAEEMDITLGFTRHDLDDDDVMRIEAHGDDIGILIGKRGATAKAIDDLVRTVLQRSGGTTRVGKIRMDIGGVGVRRSAALSDFARQVATEVLESGEEMRIEPMNRVDRKIMHDVVTKIGGVSSHSEGNDSLRHVVIGVVPEDF